MAIILTTEELIIDIPGRAPGVPLNLSLQPGQVWGVLGPNGVGKTTLLHTLAGLREPRNGQLFLDGKPLTEIRRKLVSQQMGLVFQDRQDGFPATVLETALIGRHPWLSPWQLERGEDLAIAEQALEALDVMHLRGRLVNTLSGNLAAGRAHQSSGPAAPDLSDEAAAQSGRIRPGGIHVPARPEPGRPLV